MEQQENYNDLSIKTGPTTLVDLAEEALLRYIKEKGLRPGDTLPHEDELAEKMSVGRNVVREALSRLKSMGVLDSRKRRGIVLQEPEIKKNLEKIIIPQMLSPQVMIDLLELRYTIEVGIVPTLFDRITDEDISDLQTLLPKGKLSNKVRISVEDEQNFHSRIYAILGNQALIDLQRLLIPMFRYLHDNYDKFITFNEQMKKKKLQTTHKDILDSLAARDPEKYTEVIKRHLMAYRLFINEWRLSGNSERQLTVDN